jgi:hypothetical protein
LIIATIQTKASFLEVRHHSMPAAVSHHCGGLYLDAASEGHPRFELLRFIKAIASLVLEWIF